MPGPTVSEPVGAHDGPAHVRVMGLLHAVYGLVVLALVVAFYGFGFGADDTDSHLTLHRVGDIAALPIALVGLAYVVGGAAIARGHDWPRPMMWVLSVLALGSVPLGTALGIYSIWVLSRRSRKAAA